MSALRLAVTEAAVAARCPRQFVLAREGIRVTPFGGDGIGTPLHDLAARVCGDLPSQARIVSYMSELALDGRALSLELSAIVHRALFEALPAVARTCSAASLLRWGEAATSLVPLLAVLLERAHRTGLRGEAAVRSVLHGVEQEVLLRSADGRVELSGRIDLVLRDPEAKRPYACDWKTGETDVVADEQVLAYAEALSRAGTPAKPILVHLTARGLQLRAVDEVRPASEWETRFERLRAWASGEVVPPAAKDPETCRSCPAQAACWSRWGRTLGESAIVASPEPTGSADTGRLGEYARRLEKALRTRKVRIETLDPAHAIVGPSVVRFRLRLREGEKIAAIEKAARDLQRELDWSQPPTISNDGPFVAIDAPRPDREVIPWSRAPVNAEQQTVIPVGVGFDGTPVPLDLADAPHVLVGGATQSGKTNFLQGLVLALLAKARRPLIHVIDPKATDFTLFDGHGLAWPVITDPHAAITLLEKLALDELPNRTAHLQANNVRNRLELKPDAMLDAMVVVIDEFADLVMVLPKKERAAFIETVQRLLQRARSVGIHLVLATQRPSVDTVPGSLKTNLNVRIAFRLPAAVDSHTILDRAGAENLLGRGDLLMVRPGEADVRAQAYYVGLGDIRDAAAGAVASDVVP